MATKSLKNAFLVLSRFGNEIRSRPGVEIFSFFFFVLKNITRTKSQNLQDLFALFQLKEKRRGYFVDFGAGDGIVSSNSYLLETRYEWNGILAEPARARHDALRRNRNCTIEVRCVWSRSGETIVFNEAHNPDLSTIDTFVNSDDWGSLREQGTKYAVETISLNDLLLANGAPKLIDYLSVDTEGSEVDILTAFDFDKYDVRIITVEHNFSPTRDRIHSLLVSKGYVRKFQSLSQFDDWYVKDCGEPSAPAAGS